MAIPLGDTTTVPKQYSDLSGIVPVQSLPPGIGGTINSVQGLVDFGDPIGSSEDTTASVTVSASWVASDSVLLTTVVEGADHTADEIAAEHVISTVGNIQTGIGFDIIMYSPEGSTGKFLVNVIEG